MDVDQLIFIIISNAEFCQHLALSVGYYWNIHSEEFSPMRILGPKDASVAFHFKICTVQIMLLNSSNRSCLHMELFLQNHVWILPIAEKKVCLMLCLSHFHCKLK